MSWKFRDSISSECVDGEARGLSTSFNLKNHAIAGSTEIFARPRRTSSENAAPGMLSLSLP
jgi:hypothetical protein